MRVSNQFGGKWSGPFASPTGPIHSSSRGRSTTKEADPMSWNYTDPIQPSPDESCDASKNYEDGYWPWYKWSWNAGYCVEPGTFGRLLWPLRAAAADPGTMLALSPACHAMATVPATNLPGPPPPEPAFPPRAQPSAILSGALAMVGDDRTGNHRTGLADAFADLCASGRNAYAS